MFDTIARLFENDDYEKNPQMTRNHAKFPSMQRVQRGQKYGGQVVPFSFLKLKYIWVRHEKTCLRWVVKTTKAQTSLIRTFVIHLLESIISKLATSDISIF